MDLLVHVHTCRTGPFDIQFEIFRRETLPCYIRSRDHISCLFPPVCVVGPLFTRHLAGGFNNNAQSRFTVLEIHQSNARVRRARPPVTCDL
jgi:hypothetical protein